MKVLNTIAQVLIVIGALNWGLIGLFDFNLVSALFGADSFLTNLVYILVGLAGLYGLYLIATVSRGTDAVHHRDTATTTTTARTPAPGHTPRA